MNKKMLRFLLISPFKRSFHWIHSLSYSLNQAWWPEVEMQVITSLGSFGSKKVYQNDRSTSIGCMMQFESNSFPSIFNQHAGFGFSVDGRIITSFTRKCSNCFSPYCRKVCHFKELCYSNSLILNWSSRITSYSSCKIFSCFLLIIESV